MVVRIPSFINKSYISKYCCCVFWHIFNHNTICTDSTIITYCYITNDFRSCSDKDIVAYVGRTVSWMPIDCIGAYCNRL